MVRYCAVSGCLRSDNYDKNRRFFGFPSEETRRKQWLKVIGRMDLEIKPVKVLHLRYYVCDLHFVQSDIHGKRLKLDAVPTLLLPQMEDPTGLSKSIQTYIEMFASSKSTQTDMLRLMPNDMENFVEHHVMGSVSNVRMKPGCIPTKFKCKQTANTTEHPCILKQQRKTLVEECINDLEESRTTTIHLEFGETFGSSVLHGNPEKSRDPSPTETEIRVFCPKCNMEVSHTAEGIQEDQTKILIANVYHYLEQEYEELQKINGNLDLTPLSRFRQRTALATGVSETTVLQILEEEEKRDAAKQKKAPKRGRACKRPIPKYISSEDNSSDDSDHADDTNEADEQEDSVQKPEKVVETLVVKVEPPDYHTEPEIFIGPVDVNVKEEPRDIEETGMQAQTDPISAEVKIEPCDDTAYKKKLNAERAKRYRENKKIRQQSETSDSNLANKETEIFIGPVDVNVNPRDSEEISTNKTLATNKRKTTSKKKASTDETTTDARKKQRTSDVSCTLQHSQGESSTMATSTIETSSSVPVKQELDESSMLGDTEVLVEKFEIDEEGFS